ncbi:hypothetical protein Golob_014807, partial [Gossypium lobatum]|nr:hypothetical protein [Gossypium lobatum]
MIERELSYEHYYVGTFLTSSIVNFQAMKSTLANVWHPIGGVSILDIGNEQFLFQFYYEVDIIHIEKNGPWTFNSHLLQQFDWAIKEIMRVNMRFDVRKPIKRRKSLTLPPGKTVFVRFETQPRRNLVWKSKWLVEDDGGGGSKSRVSNKEDSIEVMGTLLQVPNSSRSGSNMEVIRRKCGFQSGFDVKLDGRSRGLSLGWNSNY